MMVRTGVRYREARPATVRFLRFDPVKGGCDPGIIPAVIAGIGPIVIIARMPAMIDQSVD